MKVEDYVFKVVKKYGRKRVMSRSEGEVVYI